MQLSAAGLALLKASEGFLGSAYIDCAGFPTIGYGHKLLPHEIFPQGVTEAQAATILAEDVAVAERAVTRLVCVSLTQSQFDALVDFVFNLGALRLEQSTLLRDLNVGRLDAAAAQFLLWDHSGMREVPALKVRRAAEYQLWTGHAPAK